MTTHALHREVELLSNEVARLRVMVQRCVEHRQQQAAALVVSQTPAGDPPGRCVQGVQFAAPSDPLAILPEMFSGVEGTARLFRVMMETYPWLVPPEVKEAQEYLARKRGKQAMRVERSSSSSSCSSEGEQKASRRKKREPKDSGEGAHHTKDSEGEAVKPTKEEPPIEPNPTSEEPTGKDPADENEKPTAATRPPLAAAGVYIPGRRPGKRTMAKALQQILNDEDEQTGSSHLRSSQGDRKSPVVIADTDF